MKAYPVNQPDIDRIKSIIKQEQKLTVLEFGCGHSTLAIAEALQVNRLDKLHSNSTLKKIRNNHQYKCITVDADIEWIEIAKDRLGDLSKRVEFHYSEVSVGDWNGQICHFYDNLPDIVPDFIYLDGPNPEQVKGDYYGMTFSRCPERTIMAGDILRMEPTLLPTCTILIDGRTNNARFLANNLKRKWDINHSQEGDFTIMRLNESPLNSRSIRGWKSY